MSANVFASSYDMLVTSCPNFRHSSLMRKLRKLYCLGRCAEHVNGCDRDPRVRDFSGRMLSGNRVELSLTCKNMKNV